MRFVSRGDFTVQQLGIKVSTETWATRLQHEKRGAHHAEQQGSATFPERVSEQQGFGLEVSLLRGLVMTDFLTGTSRSFPKFL